MYLLCVLRIDTNLNIDVINPLRVVFLHLVSNEMILIFLFQRIEEITFTFSIFFLPDNLFLAMEIYDISITWRRSIY